MAGNRGGSAAGTSVSVLALLLLPLLNAAGDANETLGFIKVSGQQFIKDGRAFYMNGFNAYWLMTVASMPAEKEKVSVALRQASAFGTTVVRTWAFSDAGFLPLQRSPGSYDENVFRALDFVISEAKKNGVFLLLSLVNNHDEFGGKRQYVQWARDRGQEPSSSPDDFYTNELAKTFYKNHVKAILTRNNSITGTLYKDDPTIFAWELINEPRCTSDASGKTLQAWVEEMAAYVKAIDSNHLLEVGLEGFYGNSSAERELFNPGYGLGTDFISINLVPGIDFSTIHIYTEWIPDAGEEDQLDFLMSWIRAHTRDASEILGRPLLITEFGRSRLSPGFKPRQIDLLYKTIYSYVYGSARAGGACAGSLFWQLLADGLDGLRDGYEIIFSEAPSTAGIICRQSARLSALNNANALPGQKILRNLQQSK